MQLIRNFIEADIAGGKKMGAEQLVSAMDEAATQDIRMVELWPILKQALGTPERPAAAGSDRQARQLVRGRRAPPRPDQHEHLEPGTYEHNEAITIMDAWWPKLLEAEFGPALGDEALRRARRDARIRRARTRAREPSAPDFADGWYGYVSKDLRDVLAANGEGAAPSAPTRAVLRRRLAGRLPPGAAELAAASAVGHAGSRSTATARAPKTRRRAAST